MVTSLVITTAALADPTVTPLSSGKQPHSFRAYLLRCFILPRAMEIGFHEIFVVGEFEHGDGYTWLDVPSQERNSIHDSLRKRQAGCDAATGDWVVVANDDHLFDLNFWDNCQKYIRYTAADVIAPSRWTRLRGKRERLNSGAADGYICGHAAVYHHRVLADCRWDALPTVFTYDKAHTEAITAAGFRIVFADDVQIEDIEYGATPWR